MLLKNKSLFVLAIFMVSIIGFGIAYEQISRLNTLEKYKPTGALVDLGGRTLHIDCRGEGAPTVILESGLDTLGSLSWSVVHDELAKTTRTCAYDRAGIMWSDPRPDTQNLMEAIANDLNKGLTLVGEQAPYVLVGHSFGGPYITKFDALYGDKVKGIVFVDSPHPEQMDLVQGVEIPLLSSLHIKVTETFKPLFSYIGVTRFIHSQTEAFPNQSSDHSSAVAAFYPISERNLAKEILNYSDGLKQVDSLRNFKDKPMFVLGNIVSYADMSDQQLVNAGITRELVPSVMEQDLYMSNDQASWSTNSDLKLFHNTSHYIQFDKPTEVISAIEKVVTKVRVSLE